ncbi:helix-turn-helix domain-containing protein [Flavobacterium sp.]|uniref:helix-turn-helix domain-containing protein n=1 Tax=Flavobacterium sp. TaxID=239 RepID=UPI0038FC3891
MKDTTTIKNLIGLSQEEMSMLLGITESQWSMYKSGKRDIPLAAKQQLAALLSNTQKAKSVSPESIKMAEKEKKSEKEWLKREYKAIDHKQKYLERKIIAIENIRIECFAALEVVHYLESQSENEFTISLANSIKTRATNTLHKHSSSRLLEMKLKKESYEMLKYSLVQKIKEHSTDL